MTEDPADYRRAWRDYKVTLEALADEIEAAAPTQGDGSLGGREWCEEHDVPEVMFAHAVEQSVGRFDYGVSPMHPWRIDDE